MTAEEYVVNKLEEAEEEIKLLKNSIDDLKTVCGIRGKLIKIIKRYTKLENGAVWLHISEFTNKEDREFLIEELMLKEEKDEQSNPNGQSMP